MKNEYLITKSNELIQKSRFELSLTEQKLVAYICTLINPMHDKEDQVYTISISNFIKLCNITDSGKNYNDIKKIIKKLADQSYWMMLPDGSETLVRWIEKPKISDKTIKFKLDEDMSPYLLQLKEKFTTYEIKNILNMKSCYAPRLYEILKSYEFVHEVTYSIDELKKI